MGTEFNYKTEGNCSVYYLSSGNIMFNLINNTNTTKYSKDVFPAFYITNCSMEDIKGLEASNYISTLQNAIKDNTIDNAAALIALSFTASAICSACWMLSLFLYLSPRHKRKPLMAQFATIFYSIVTSILLSTITDELSQQYNIDKLDILSLHQEIYKLKYYKIPEVFAQFFIGLAYLQLVLHMSKFRWRWFAGLFFVIILIAQAVINLVFAAQHQISISKHKSPDSWLTKGIVCITLRLVIMAQVFVALIYYTVIIKDVRVAYSKLLLPSAFMNMLLIVSYFVLLIISITYFHFNWYSYFWLEFIINTVEILLVTLLWEWIINIAIIEKRDEMSGVLGRRFSMDDITSIDPTLGVGMQTHKHFTQRVKQFFAKKSFPVTKDDIKDSNQSSSSTQNYNERSSINLGVAQQNSSPDLIYGNSDNVSHATDSLAGLQVSDDSGLYTIHHNDNESHDETEIDLSEEQIDYTIIEASDNEENHSWDQGVDNYSRSTPH